MKQMAVSTSHLIRFCLVAIILGLLVYPSCPALGAVDDVVGHYEGAWTNITFGSVGAAVIDIEVTGTTASLTFDMDGGVFGGTDPAQITMPGSVQGDLIQIDNQGVGIYGDIEGVVDSAAGTLTATLTNIPGGYIQEVTVEGTVANGVIDLDYTVVFPGPLGQYNPAVGVMTAVSVPVPALTITNISVQVPNVLLEWAGGEPPFVVQSNTDLLQDMWFDAGPTTTNSMFSLPYSPSNHVFFRVSGQ